MEPKSINMPRVIVEYKPLGASDGPGAKAMPMFCAGYVEGYGGGDIVIQMPIGRHLFSRKDGTWLEGDCLNYVDAKIMDFEKVEASIQAGYSGDVEMHAKSLPMVASS